MKRVAFLISIVAILSLGMAAPVLAAVPDNDAYDGRTVIDSIPFTQSIDTTEATTDADDAEANDPILCGAPATDASVWYESVAPADGFFLVDVSASDFPAGVIVASGSPGGLTFVTCGPGAVIFAGVSGVAYAILAFDFFTATGGMLNITVDEVPPPPVVELTVDPAGSFNARTGAATIRGTVTCTGGDEFAKLSVQVSQTVGRFKFFGEGGTNVTCDGTIQPWSAEAISQAGKFGGGKASVLAHLFTCNIAGCTEGAAERVVTLKK